VSQTEPTTDPTEETPEVTTPTEAAPEPRYRTAKAGDGSPIIVDVSADTAYPFPIGTEVEETAANFNRGYWDTYYYSGVSLEYAENAREDSDWLSENIPTADLRGLAARVLGGGQ